MSNLSSLTVRDPNANWRQTKNTTSQNQQNHRPNNRDNNRDNRDNRDQNRDNNRDNRDNRENNRDQNRGNQSGRTGDNSGVYRPPGSRKDSRTSEESKVPVKQAVKQPPIKVDEFPSLSGKQQTQKATSGPSWSSMVGKKADEVEKKSVTAPLSVSEFGQVENWNRESPKLEPTKVIDMSGYQRKVQEYKQQKRRPRHLPQIMVSNNEEEERIRLKEELIENEYWDKKYAADLPTEEDEVASDDAEHPIQQQASTNPDPDEE